MRTVGGAILILWLLVSLSVYGYRAWRRLTQGPKAARESTANPSVSSRSMPPLSTTPESPPLAPILPSSLAPTSSPPPPAAPTVPPTASPAATPVDRPVDRPASTRPAVPFATLPGHEPTPPATAPAGGGRGGLFAGASKPDVQAAPASPGGKAPVAEALSGIQMPCDLVPLMATDGVLDPYHVTFMTTAVAPAEVGAALGDELERLGFSLSSMSDVQVVAQRGDAQVTVTLVPNAAEAVDGDVRRYPTVPAGSVVVDIRS